jgi:hypothetical protein
MQAFSVVGLFCEDIREEKAGTDSLIGIMPDNIQVPNVPGMLTKLALYTRMNIDVKFDPGAISLLLVAPDGHRTLLSEIPSELITKAIREANEKGAPYAGIISRTGFGTFGVQKPGRVVVVANTGGEDHFVAALNFEIASTALAD